MAKQWMKVALTVMVAWALAPFFAPVQHASAETVTYQVVTNEITANQKNGDKTEVYRFDPAVYVVHQGDDVVLSIRGVKGHDHPISLEGYQIHDVVHRNEVTTVKFKADKAGFFRLICTAHADSSHEGPMEAYLVVTPNK